MVGINTLHRRNVSIRGSVIRRPPTLRRANVERQLDAGEGIHMIRDGTGAAVSIDVGKADLNRWRIAQLSLNLGGFSQKEMELAVGAGRDQEHGFGRRRFVVEKFERAERDAGQRRRGGRNAECGSHGGRWRDSLALYTKLQARPLSSRRRACAGEIGGHLGISHCGLCEGNCVFRGPFTLPRRAKFAHPAQADVLTNRGPALDHARPNQWRRGTFHLARRQQDRRIILEARLGPQSHCRSFFKFEFDFELVLTNEIV